jgi:hypothetical protein
VIELNKSRAARSSKKTLYSKRLDQVSFYFPGDQQVYNKSYLKKVLFFSFFNYLKTAKNFHKYVEKSQYTIKLEILDTRANYPGTRVAKKVANYPGTRVLDTRRWKH